MAVFFFLSKLLDVALDPLWWAIVPLGFALLAFARRPRLARAGLGFGLAALLIFSLPLVADQLWVRLEREAPNTYRPEVTYDVVVLLGGVVDTGGTTVTQTAYGHNVDRMTTVFDLLRTDKAHEVIITGGHLADGLPSEAVLLRNQLVAWGIASERIVLDETARNTHDNAVESAKLVASHRYASVLLVTSAFHMVRAVGCFKAAGVKFDALPVDYRLRERAADNAFFPRAEYLADAARALREYTGRAVYTALGYSK